MGKIAIVVHGGAKSYSPKIDEHFEDYQRGLRNAIEVGYEILRSGGSALDAVQAAVMVLEDNPFFNAGRGAALNAKGQIAMDASLMEGKDLKCGAVAIVKNVRNPIMLARHVMDNTSHVFLGGEGLAEFASASGLQTEAESYFITDDQVEEYKETSHKADVDMYNIKLFGTVGAVAVDRDQNVAAATSTGGTTYQMEGRIGDSCMIGAGCYANNETCAVSVTGDGEGVIQGVVAHSISAAVEYGSHNLQDACDFVVHEKCKRFNADVGVIAVNSSGDIATSFNSDCMLRASKREGGETSIEIK
jgi:L-asparaginase / beta-aspartyl-peptidase